MKLLIIFFIICFPFIQFSQSLWVDSNPYSNSNNLNIGSVIRVVFKETSFENLEIQVTSDEKITIESIPDKNMLKELPTYSSNKSIVKKNQGKSSVKNKLTGNIAVLITDIDYNTLTADIEGEKKIIFNDEIKRITLSGTISLSKVDKSYSIESWNVANLNISIEGKISPKYLNNPDIQLKTNVKDDGTVEYKAEISEEEKQTILLDYIKRMLGESK